MDDKFLHGEILTLTLNGGLGRGYVYKNGINEIERNSFHNFLRSEFPIFIQRNYQNNNIDDEQHCRVIDEFSNLITQKFHAILLRDRLRIGITQKLINLYLKYLWRLCQMANWQTTEPPHCPFDSIIIGKLKNYNPNLLPYTQCDSLNQYMDYVKAARLCIKEEFGNRAMSIAQWELNFWNENRRY